MWNITRKMNVNKNIRKRFDSGLDVRDDNDPYTYDTDISDEELFRCRIRHTTRNKTTQKYNPKQ